MSLYQEDQPNFWKKIGRIGIVQERKKQIPLEVVQSDMPVYPGPVNCTDEFNVDIRFEEITQALRAAKT